MDRVLALTKEGHLLSLEPPNCDLKAIDNSHLKLSSISNSEWCFWSVSFDFEIYLSIYKRNRPLEVVECCFENQKRYQFNTKRSQNNRIEFSEYLLDQNNKELSSNDTSRDSIDLPSSNWTWLNDWSFETKEDNKHGWTYGFSFQTSIKTKPSWYDLYRTRKWIRKRAFVSYETFIRIENPFDCEFINKISVGGWLLSDSEKKTENYKGDLCVWISSNCGRLFFRENVSFKNPEGTSWRSVDLANNYTVASINCTAYGDLWVATNQGTLLHRRSITKSQPYGQGWLILSLPYENCVFTQLAADEYTIFGLDAKNSVYLCKNIDKASTSAVNNSTIVWEKVLKDIKCISLSLSKMLWAVSTDNKTCYIFSKLGSIQSKNFECRCISSSIDLDRLDASVAIDNLNDSDKISLL